MHYWGKWKKAQHLVRLEPIISQLRGVPSTTVQQLLPQENDDLLSASSSFKVLIFFSMLSTMAKISFLKASTSAASDSMLSGWSWAHKIADRTNLIKARYFLSGIL